MKAEQLMTQTELVAAALKRLQEGGVKLDTSKGEREAFELACMTYGVDCVGHPRFLADEVLYRHGQRLDRMVIR